MRLWLNLCIEFHRQGPPCPVSNVIHFKTISTLGPKLFAVSLDTLQVFYHENDQWHQYQSARNIQIGILIDLMKAFSNDHDYTDDDLSREDNGGEDRDEDGQDQQAKDSHANNDLKYQINQAILYYCLFQMLVSIHLHIYIIQQQPFIH
ncbi:unnamed protein product [Rotaria sp. Silwood2]|nr:unnamed protein product [Rotaria sp. Silwood2]CAF4184042.1 unnamed protein product [Rotaria sp. Silwood2]